MPLDQEIGYLEQGYVNVATAPLDMQLDAIQMRKTALSQAQSNLRNSNYREDQRRENGMIKDRYIAFMEKQAGEPSLTPTQRIEGQNKFIRENPDVQGNVDVMRMLTNNAIRVDKTIDRTNKRADRDITDKQNKLTESKIAWEAENLADRQELEENKIAFGMQNLEHQVGILTDAQDQIAQGKTDGITDSVSQAFGSSDEDKLAKRSAVALADSLASSKNPDDRPLLNALANVSSGLKFGASLSDVYLSSLHRHKDLHEEIKDSLGGDIFRNFHDPATRNERIDELIREVTEDKANNRNTKFTEDTLPRLKSFFADLAKITSIEGTYKQLKADYSAATQEMWALRESSDPEAQKKMQLIASNLKVQANEVRAWVRAQHRQKKTYEDNRDRDLTEQKRILDLRVQLENANLNQRKFLQKQIMDSNLVGWRKASNLRSQLKFIAKMDDNNDWEGLSGIDKDDDNDKKIIYLNGKSNDTSFEGGNSSLPSIHDR